MKKTLSILLLFLALSLSLHAEDKPGKTKKEKKFNARLDLTSLVFTEFRLSFDYKVHPHITLGLIGSYIKRPDGLKWVKKTKTTHKQRVSFPISAWSLGLGSHFALGHEVFTNGFTISPYISYTNHSHGGEIVTEKNLASETFDTLNRAHSFFTFGSLFAYEWFWENGLNTSLGFGAHYDTNYLASYSDVLVIRPYLEWSFGFAF